jgi:hypothetical protein
MEHLDTYSKWVAAAVIIMAIVYIIYPSLSKLIGG